MAINRLQWICARVTQRAGTKDAQGDFATEGRRKRAPDRSVEHSDNGRGGEPDAQFPAR